MNDAWMEEGKCSVTLALQKVSTGTALKLYHGLGANVLYDLKQRIRLELCYPIQTSIVEHDHMMTIFKKRPHQVGAQEPCALYIALVSDLLCRMLCLHQ